MLEGPNDNDRAQAKAAANGLAHEFLIDAKAYDGTVNLLSYAFARHRLAALRTPPDDAVKLREALETFARAATDAERLVGHDGPLGQFVSYDDLCRARAALKGTPNDE